MIEFEEITFESQKSNEPIAEPFGGVGCGLGCTNGTGCGAGCSSTTGTGCGVYCS